MSTASKKSRFELHPEPQTWLGKLLNPEVDGDARDEILKMLSTKEVMRTHLLSKSALAASPAALKMRMKELLIAQAAEEEAEAKASAALGAAKTV